LQDLLTHQCARRLVVEHPELLRLYVPVSMPLFDAHAANLDPIRQPVNASGFGRLPQRAGRIKAAQHRSGQGLAPPVCPPSTESPQYACVRWWFAWCIARAR